MRMLRVVLISSVVILIGGCAGIGVEVSAATPNSAEQQSNTSYGHYYYDGQRYYRPQKSSPDDKTIYPLHSYWQDGSGGNIPRGAVAYDKIDDMDVYRCRANYGLSQYYGKAHGGNCYIDHPRGTIVVPRYEVYVEGY